MSHIDNILELSNLDSGKVTINAQKIAIRPFVEEILEAHRGLASANNVHMGLSIEPHVPSEINMDPVRVGQVLKSLIGNSLKFTQEGAISVRVMNAGRGLLRFEVIDTGIGIEDSIKSTIFSAFMPGDASLTKRHAGVGIGLALSKRLIELMDGTIDFESTKGSGARFWFQIPETTTLSAAGSQLPAPIIATDRPQQLSILIAEDNAVNLKVLLAMLPKDCFDVHIAQDGRQAVDLFLRKSFDLILMDCQMPHLSGLDATTAIRRLESKVGLRRTPIIAVTAMSMDGDREKCLSVGMDDHLSKPVHRKVLLESLQRWLPASACGG